MIFVGKVVSLVSKGRFFVGKSRVLVDKGRFFAGEVGARTLKRLKQ